MLWLERYADVQAAFRSRDFEQGGGGRRDSAPIVGDSLLSLSGDPHFARRRLESVLFRRSELVHYQRDVLLPSLQRTLDACRTTQRGPDGIVRTDLTALLRWTLLRLSARLAGLDGVDEDPERLAAFRACTDRLAEGVNAEWMNTDHAEVIRGALEAKEHFTREFFVPAWRRREVLASAHAAGRVASDELPRDLMMLLVRERDAFAGWDPDVLVREAILFSGATTGTIATTLPHIVVELSAWLGDHPEDRQHLLDSEFLRRAASESLRLHPPAPYLIRRAIRDTVLPSGASVGASQYVVLDLIRANRDPAAMGAEPDRFDLHRQVADQARPYGLSFGDGPHTCIGRGLAIGEVSGGSSDVDAPGLIVTILRELYRAGMELDPDDPPRWSDQSVRNDHAAVPVRLVNP
jgi:cytochrome P450